MFSGKFISASKGTSKAGRDWFRVDLIAETVSGSNKVIQSFCTSTAYNSALAIQSMADVKVSCGVNDNGYITVNYIKEVER